jgi:transaldolase/glucose-6-phosphate isomerase
MTLSVLTERSLPPDVADAWQQSRERWRQLDGTARLWRRDATLFTGAGEDRWLGWLDLPERPFDPGLERIASAVLAAGIRRVVLLGMGGSSLGAEALVVNLARDDHRPPFTVVDTTEPLAVGSALDAARTEPTFVIAASKSGGTLETELLLRAFSQHVAADRLAVVTDPGSKLEHWAQAGGSEWILHGDPEVGGRFSVLSPFGLVAPAALGIALEEVVVGARRAAAACREEGASNPGVELGTLMAAAAKSGRMLLTILAGEPGSAAFADWLEQLVAESLGKRGRGLLPVVGERATGDSAEVLHRHQARLVLACEPHAPPTAALEALGVPVVAIDLEGPQALGFELFRCEVATAVAGALLGIDPFDQPDVESAKVATRAWIARAAEGGELEAGERAGASQGVVAYAPARTRSEPAASAAAALDRLLSDRGDAVFCSLLAFLPTDPTSRAALDRLRAVIAERHRLACTVGIGPRYLHSTGQFHKGGADCGVFVVLSRSVGSLPEESAVPIPGHDASFAQVHAAQALGDFEALAAKGRRVLHLEVGGGVAATLSRVAAELASLPAP